MYFFSFRANIFLYNQNKKFITCTNCFLFRNALCVSNTLLYIGRDIPVTCCVYSGGRRPLIRKDCMQQRLGIVIFTCHEILGHVRRSY